MVNAGRVSRALAAALFALALAIPAAAESRDTNAPVSNVNRFAAIRIANFGKVNTNYYRGAQPQDHDYADLAAAGIKTVIDFTENGEVSEPSIVKGLGQRSCEPACVRALPGRPSPDRSHDCRLPHDERRLDG